MAGDNFLLLEEWTIDGSFEFTSGRASLAEAIGVCRADLIPEFL